LADEILIEAKRNRRTLHEATVLTLVARIAHARKDYRSASAALEQSVSLSEAGARRIVGVFDDHRRRIEALGRPAASVLRVFEHMQRNPIVSIPAAAERIGISAPTVAKLLEHMHELGMLREITGKQRHRLFVYEAYLAILSEDTEPIR
jgi:Fic family protein